MPVPAGDSVGRLAVPGAPTDCQARGLFPDPERVRVTVQTESGNDVTVRVKAGIRELLTVRVIPKSKNDFD